MTGRRVILAITGASGAVYGLRLAEELLQAGVHLTLLISEPGFAVLKEECGEDWRGGAATTRKHLRAYFRPGADRLDHFANDDFLAPIASGSRVPDAMVICPCSMGTVGRIAAGLSGTLIERCADVMLKEGRTLLLVPRETPLSEIHLENLLKVTRAGARVIPAMPAFYHHPASPADMVDFIVGKVLDQLGVANRLFARWGGEPQGR